MGGWPILECYSEIILLRGVDGWLRQGEVAAEAVSMLRGIWPRDWPRQSGLRPAAAVSTLRGMAEGQLQGE